MASRERFGRISEISSDEASWRDRLFLTIDVDWASDEVIEDTAAKIEAAGVSATWFITHDTPMLERLRTNPRFELGIHPNFNFLLEGDGRNGADAAEVLDRLLRIVPEARAVRSHSMTQSSVLLNLFAERGLTHDCNHFVPNEAQIALKPWRHWNGMIKVPYFWEDDVHCMGRSEAIDALVERPGLRVFDFHPIHVFLNTESLDRYEEARPFFDSPEHLRARRNEGEGTSTALDRLLRLSQGRAHDRT